MNPQIIGIILWFSISGNPLFDIQKSAWLICSEAGATPVLQEWFGGIPDSGPEAVAAIGTCPAYLNIHISQEPMGLWAIALMSPLISIIALLFYRSSMKEHSKGDNIDMKKSLTSRSLYIGFLGKVIGQITFFIIVLIILPALNGGVFFEFADSIRVQYGADPTAYERALFVLWSFTLVITPAAIGFEALMFVHAALKDTIFGIDSNLRKTFTNTLFTGIGAISFVIVSEAMENIVGYGMLGGVVIGATIIFARHPIIGLIDGVSSRLIPEEYSPSELKYLEAYADAIQDMVLTDREKSLLANLAIAYEIKEERLAVIEKKYRESLSKDSETTIHIQESE